MFFALKSVQECSDKPESTKETLLSQLLPRVHLNQVESVELLSLSNVIFPTLFFFFTLLS